MVVFGILLAVDYSTGRTEVYNFGIRSLGANLVGEFYAIGTVDGKDRYVFISYEDFITFKNELAGTTEGYELLKKVSVYRGGLTCYKYNITLCG